MSFAINERSFAAKLVQSKQTVVIEGYAHRGDADPTEAALDRANVMRNQLIEKGVAPGQLQVRAIGVEPERLPVRGVTRERDRAVLGLGVARDVVLGQASEAGVPVRDTDGTPALDDVAVEGLTDRDELIRELPDALARRLVPVDPRTAEVTHTAEF